MNGAGVGDQDSASAPTTQYPLPCPYNSWLAQAPRTYLWNIWHPIVCRTPITSRGVLMISEDLNDGTSRDAGEYGVGVLVVGKGDQPNG